MAIPERLLAILACPQCKGEVKLSSEGESLLCKSCRLAYPVRDGIPVMMVDEAEEIAED